MTPGAPRLTVGLDASAACVRDPTGVAAAITHTARALAERADIDLVLLLRASRWRKRRLLPAIPLARRRWLLGPMWMRRGLEVIHGLDVRVPERRFAGLPSVATIHDFSALQPGGFSKPSFAETRAQHYRDAAKADRVVVYSQAIAAEASERLDLPPERIVTVPLAPALAPASPEARAALRAELGAAPFVLVLGELSRRKNTLGALQAWARAREMSEALRERRLVIAGRPGFGAEEVEAALAGAQGVTRLGYVSAERRSALLAEAELLLFPSRYEGFGLPALEAMSLGCPVLASRCGALRELCGEAARLREAEDVEGFAEELVALAEGPELRTSLRRAGMARSAGLTWDRTAARLAELYRRLASGAALRAPPA